MFLLSQTHSATQRDVDAAFYRRGPPPPAVNDDFARRIKQAERAYRGARPAEYLLGLFRRRLKSVLDCDQDPVPEVIEAVQVTDLVHILDAAPQGGCRVVL